jgi:hypothetical protein
MYELCYLLDFGNVMAQSPGTIITLWIVPCIPLRENHGSFHVAPPLRGLIYFMSTCTYLEISRPLLSHQKLIVKSALNFLSHTTHETKHEKKNTKYYMRE